MASKPGDDHLSRDEPGGDLLTAQVVSGMEAARAQLGLWYGTWEPVALIRRPCGGLDLAPRSRQGGLQAAGTARGRVPKRGTGTDRLVVVVRPGNAGGAKGSGHSGMSGGQP